MSLRLRYLVFLVGAAGAGLMFVLAAVQLPVFGGDVHPYRDLVVPNAIARGAPNVVSSVNFDQRAWDTFGEETILLASVVGAATLMRRGEHERERDRPDEARQPAAARLLSYVLLPVTMLVGLDVVVHGHLTPGGGFQGGVVLATGLHLLYVAGSYDTLRRVRPLAWYERTEAVAAGGFAVLAVSGLVVAGSALANFLPFGTAGDLVAAGTVPLLNIAVGAEVASGVVVLLAQFLAQAVVVTR